MIYPIIMKSVIPADAISNAAMIVEHELHSLHTDYSGGMHYAEFVYKRIYSDSNTLLMLQARCLYRGIADELISDALLAEIGNNLKSTRFFCKPFVRYAFPGMSSNGRDRMDNVLNSPLHYDEYGEDTRSTWIPLHDIDEETGALCFTDNKKLAEIGAMSPEYAHNTDLGEEYIGLLRSEITEVRCSAGDVVMFDRTKLHGATYPKTKPRISIDLRWVESPAGCDISDAKKAIKKYSRGEIMRLRDTAFIYRSPWLTVLYVAYKLRANLKIRTRIIALFRFPGKLINRAQSAKPKYSK